MVHFLQSYIECLPNRPKPDDMFDIKNMRKLYLCVMTFDPYIFFPLKLRILAIPDVKKTDTGKQRMTTGN